MKNLKFLGVLLAGIFMPIVVNAATCTETSMAKIGDVCYDSVKEAVAAVPTSVENVTTIEVLKSGSVDGIVIPSGTKLILDLNGFKLTFSTGTLVGSKGTETQNMQLLKNSTITIKNGELVASENSKTMIQNYSNLTLEDVTLDGRTEKDEILYPDDPNTYYTLSLNNGSITLRGKTNIYSNEIAFDAYYWPANGYVDGAKVTVDTTGKVIGDIEVSANSNPGDSTTILDILNINHEGEINVLDSLLEKNVRITKGIFTSDVNAYLKDKISTKAIKEGEKYTVYSEKNVSTESLNGTVKVDKSTGYKGDVVTLTLTPKKDYELAKIEVINADTKETVKVTDNKFTMPDANVFVKVTFKAITPEVITPELSDKNTVGISKDAKVEDVLLATLKNSKEFQDKDVKVHVVVADVKATDDVKKDFGKALEDKTSKDAKILSYFDITVAVKDALTDTQVGKLSELSDKIEFLVTVPKLDAVKEGFTRKFYIIKEHNGKIEILNGVTSEDGKTVAFETKEFSTYALAYEDVAVNNVEVPKTLDSIASTLLITTVSLSIVIGAYVYFKRELENK